MFDEEMMESILCELRTFPAQKARTDSVRLIDSVVVVVVIEVFDCAALFLVLSKEFPSLALCAVVLLRMFYACVFAVYSVFS